MSGERKSSVVSVTKAGSQPPSSSSAGSTMVTPFFSHGSLSGSVLGHSVVLLFADIPRSITGKSVSSQPPRHVNRGFARHSTVERESKNLAMASPRPV